MTDRVPELPRQLITDTADLMITLDQTVANLRAFTEKLRAATEQSRQEGAS
ncbi:hypothetical protein ACXJJ3_08660 [Kribbella sp. WER1]|uniref:hypothetical protein n=1 Tax=Kribbella sp. NPDC059898 TaxID=3346995 RepID=UPI0036654978